eukprot:gnl/TRDRNA2_/TRDRNA2_183437_c0_seq1.p1 gnl/TRDRNA2_/TRDRNA2_183437_c0~~gnl/TRDRNA2_/TRDRNA2_183437_c0_seq1.p1  ORF type:complete len:139 (-),score=33.22 gnl/TRDRNA2_/TRDRNA2_183437_c0_seq1:155-571(-)
MRCSPCVSLILAALTIWASGAYAAQTDDLSSCPSEHIDEAHVENVHSLSLLQKAEQAKKRAEDLGELYETVGDADLLELNATAGESEESDEQLHTKKKPIINHILNIIRVPKKKAEKARREGRVIENVIENRVVIVDD